MTHHDETNEDEGALTVVVLGMHRSGTSMIGGLLDALGIDMGNEFHPSTNANPTGFFEDLSFLRLNRRILQAAGGGHLAPPSAEAILAQQDVFRQEIRDLVAAKTSRRWGWKDPRTCLTLDLYLEHLPRPHVIVCRRDPDAIARSLQTRSGMPLEEGLRLTAVYEDRLHSFLARHADVPRLEVTYEVVTRDPNPWIEKIIDFFDLTPTEAERARALALVLPRDQLRTFKLKRRLKKNLKRPWEIPGLLLQRIRLNKKRKT